MIRPTSKIALKMTCLEACGNDIEQAQRLYDFFIRDMENLPDMEPVVPTRFEQARDAVGSLFGWLRDNKGEIMEAWDFVSSLRGTASSATPKAGVAPIPDNV